MASTVVHAARILANANEKKSQKTGKPEWQNASSEKLGKKTCQEI